MKRSAYLAAPVLAVCLPALSLAQSNEGFEWQIPKAGARLPFAKEQPIVFVTTKNLAQWKKLPKFWNTSVEQAEDPATGETVSRTVVRIKMPLGLSEAPRVPVDNPMTVARWKLGRRLYFDPALASDGITSCASCHNPSLGFTDQSPVSVGIFGLKGGVSAPTVMNSGLNLIQFWDGRAATLEEQAQGPPGNAVEMFDGKGNAWNSVVLRVRKKDDYTPRFLEAFGTEPTRDAIAKAIACYERTVFNGNSIHDRAEQAMQFRVAEEESTNFTIQPKDYAKVLKEAFASKDTNALSALKLDPAKDEAKIAAVAEQVSQGRTLYFGKARCNLCHVGQNFSDSLFHNLGVGVKDGKIPESGLGRFGALPTGHKDPEQYGAFKTPTLRGLLSTAPYMHDGSEKTLEEVVDFYDRGGNPHPFLSPKMRDLQAERNYVQAKRRGQPYVGPRAYVFGSDESPIVPFQLKLTPQEKTALVMFMRSLEGEVDDLVKDVSHQPN